MMDRLLQFYQEQIHFLIQKESVAYGICIDLTDNTMLAKVDQNLNLIFFDDQKIKYDSWLKTHIYQHIPYIDEVNELQDILQ